MNKNTIYLIESENEVLEINLHYQKTHQMRIRKIFEEHCLQELTTLKGRQDAVKRLFGYGYNVPVYINQSMLFIKVRSLKTIWINCAAVCAIIKTTGGSDIIFPEDHVLNTKANYRGLMTSYRKAMAVLKHKNDFIFD